VIESGRTEKNDGDYQAVDMTCDGKIDGAFYKPDDKKKGYRFTYDINGDDEADVWIYDHDRDGAWDISFWATKFDEQIDVVGFHPDGKLEPTSYTSFDAYKAKMKEQQAQKR
jgi:hypothetical protein